MQAGPWESYSSFQPVTPSSSTLINCRQIYCGSAGNLVVAAAFGGTLVTFAVLAGTRLPIELNEGIIDVTTTATGIVALA